jgi:hypothetical protein
MVTKTLMFKHPMTVRGLEHFLKDWEEAKPNWRNPCGGVGFQSGFDATGIAVSSSFAMQ